MFPFFHIFNYENVFEMYNYNSFTINNDVKY